MRQFSLILLGIVACVLWYGCTTRAPEPQQAIKIVQRINAELSCIRNGVEDNIGMAKEILAHPDRYKHPRYAERVYRYYQDTLYYAVGAKGEGAIMASGYTPVDETLARKVRRLEHLEDHLKIAKEACAWVSMAWLGTEESIGVFYPPFDLVAFTPLKLNIPKEIIPYAKAATDTEQSLVWTEPYVDLTGKGYMVTASAPVFVDGHLQGVVGADMALEPLVSDLLGSSDQLFILLSQTGYVMGTTRTAAEATHIQALGNLDYLEQVPKDVPAPGAFRLSEQATHNVTAKHLTQIIADTSRADILELEGKNYSPSVHVINECGWRVVELLPVR